MQVDDPTPASQGLYETAGKRGNGVLNPETIGESESIIVLSDDGSIQEVSASVSEMLGYSPGFLSGSPIFRLIYEHDLLNVFRGVSNLVSGRIDEADMNVRMRTAGGCWRTFRASAHLRLNGSSVVGILIVLYPALSAFAS